MRLYNFCHSVAFGRIILSAKQYTISQNNSYLSLTSLIAEAFVDLAIISKRRSSFDAKKSDILRSGMAIILDAFGPCQPNAAPSFLMVRHSFSCHCFVICFNLLFWYVFFSTRVALFLNDMLQSYERYAIICLTYINLLDRCDGIAECFVHFDIFLLSVVLLLLCMRFLFLFSFKVSGEFLAWKMMRPMW